MSIETYLTLALFCFIGAMIYFNVTNHESDQALTLFQKIFYSLISALIFPLIIIGGLMLFGIGLLGHGG